MTSDVLWILLAPGGLAAVGFLPTGALSPRALARVAFATALLALAVALLTVAAVAMAGPLHSGTIGWQGAGLGLYADALSASMLLLVSFVGAAVLRFSENYLDGDPRHGLFLQRLCRTVAAVLLLVVSGNLALLVAAWIATSLALNSLLTFYGERPGAMLAARKKFVVSRAGDLCLIVASLLLYGAFGSFEIVTILAAATAPGAAGGLAAVHAAALLVAAAALLKSAQFPLHGWLLEVMETPTPVSALLHAGIINAGGFLVLRLSPIVAQSSPALDTLAIVGGATALFGCLAMLTQTSVKVSLAYSTVAQMGFMLLQCGLGAFSAAALHIVAHSLYKAHAFLSSGSVVDLLRSSWTLPPGPRPHRGRLLLSLAIVLAAAFAVSWMLGADLVAKPGIFALGAIMLMGLTILLSGAIDERLDVRVLGRVALAAGLVGAAYFGLQRGAELLLQGAVAPTQALRGPFDLAVVLLVVLSFAGVVILQAELGRPSGALRHRLYVHLSNGLYVNTLANRLALRLWPGPGRGRRPDARALQS